MKIKIVSILLVSAALLLCGCSKQIDGQIFVSTQGGNSYKLGSVQVSVVTANDLKPVLKQYINDAFVLKNESVNEVRKITDMISSSIIPLDSIRERNIKQYVQTSVVELALKQVSFDETNIAKIYNLSPVVSTSTDSEGKFSVVVNTTSDCYLLAKTVRAISLEKSERYYWIIKLSNNTKQNIMLNSLNMIELEFSIDDADKTSASLEALIK